MGNRSALLPPDQLWAVNALLGPNLQGLNEKGADFSKHTILFAVVLTNHIDGSFVEKASTCMQQYSFYRILIVDDESTDGSNPQIQERSPDM